MIELGGNIKLDGFHDANPSTMIVVKKIIGNYAKKIQEETGDFQELLLHLKENTEKKVTLKANLTGNKNCSSEASDINLYFAINYTLSKILEDAKK